MKLRLFKQLVSDKDDSVIQKLFISEKGDFIAYDAKTMKPIEQLKKHHCQKGNYDYVYWTPEIYIKKKYICINAILNVWFNLNPASHKVDFKDGDCSNLSIDNLDVMTIKEYRYKHHLDIYSKRIYEIYDRDDNLVFKGRDKDCAEFVNDPIDKFRRGALTCKNYPTSRYLSKYYIKFYEEDEDGTIQEIIS